MVVFNLKFSSFLVSGLLVSRLWATWPMVSDRMHLTGLHFLRERGNTNLHLELNGRGNSSCHKDIEFMGG